MHDAYRLTIGEMRSLVAHARAGETFELDALRARDPAAAPIAVVRFEDGRLMLRDGLHRATAILVGRPSGRLAAGELVIEELTYEMFLRPALAAGLYAPFDPRTEVRIADFRWLRDEVQRELRAGRDPIAYIDAHRHAYTRPRRPHHETLARFYAECSPYGPL